MRIYAIRCELFPVSRAATTVDFAYGYNADNQRSSDNVSDARFLFHPAAASSIAYAPNNLNQYTTVGGASLSYDGNGNLTGDGSAGYSYDTQNQLTSASAQGNTIAYAYGPLGRRQAKTVNTTTTDYLLAGQQVIAAYDASGTLLRRYVYGASGRTAGHAHRERQHQYAELRPPGWAGLGGGDQRWGHRRAGRHLRLRPVRAERDAGGQRLDAESGLYYYRARNYSPVLGRFLQPDPSGTRGGQS